MTQPGIEPWSHRPLANSLLIMRMGLRIYKYICVGQLTETGSNYTFFLKGKPADEAKEHGVGFDIKSSLSKNLQELPFGTSERIISLRLPLRQKCFVTIMSVYAHTMDSPETNILSFYDELRQLFLNIPDDDKIILLGNLNVRVRRDSQTWKCLGSHGLRKANSNGACSFCNFATSMMSSLETRGFVKKTNAKVHGNTHALGHWYMIDYVIVRWHDLQDLHQVLAMRGTECWTDHHLVRAKMDTHKFAPKHRHTTTPHL